MGTLIAAIELEPNWLEAVLGRIALRDEVERVRIQRLQVQEKLKRLGNAYLDLLVTEEEYKRRKRLLDLEMESLVVPQANAAEEAGRLVQDLPRLWSEASEEERRRLLLTMLDGVYVDCKDEKAVVGIKPKPAFGPVFQVATTREGSGVTLVKENPRPMDRRMPFQRTPQQKRTPSGVHGGDGGAPNSPYLKTFRACW
ncbi:MAG: hypothetical protein IIC61_02925 [Proteobacteria bacterium]|nr:hypothetical protein [Pseudomonadota bacterium]